MKLEDIQKSMQKNPAKWAQMFLDSQKQLDLALTEMDIMHRKAKQPKGMFDAIKAGTYSRLLRVISGHMFQAYKLEGSGAVAQLGEKVSTRTLNQMRKDLTAALDIVTKYCEMRAGSLEDQVSLSLIDNNPCNITWIGQNNDEISQFQTVEEGLARTFYAIKWTIAQSGGSMTYREFIRAWYSDYTSSDELIDRALMYLGEVRQLDTPVLVSEPNLIIIAQVLTAAEYTRPVDKAYLDKHYTLDKYVEALSYQVQYG